MKQANHQQASGQRASNDTREQTDHAQTRQSPFNTRGSKVALQRYKRIVGRAQPSRPRLQVATLDGALQGGQQRDGECLHEIYEDCADANPSAIALECGTRVMTYEDLEKEANRLARYLRSQGVVRGATVGLLLERSEWPIIASLAILKAGGTYVPIDPSLPVERIRYIAEHADFAALVTDDALKPNADAAFAGAILTINGYRATASSMSSSRLSRDETGVKPQDVCYILFTSGTTGRPKGVVTEHRNAAHFVHAFNEACDTTAADRIFQGFAMGFDGSVEEIWMAFSNGATLVCGDRNTPKFGAELAEFMNDTGITYFSTVPTMLSTLTTDIPSLRQVVVSGEACQAELVKRWATDERTMLNVYGPTEATVNTTIAKLEPDKPVTIGVPLRGYELHVLDDKLKPVPHGEKGELYIGGPGISRGYLKQAEQTAAAYINWDNPNALLSNGSAGSGQGERIYKTGDLVRWNADGELEIFGRIDSQVKLRGYRVELAEIEKVLLELPEIAGAVVTVAKINGLDQLAAYVLLSDGAGKLDRQYVLTVLRSRLAPYMIPASLDVLGEFPMLVSGKINRKLLPPPKRSLVILDPIAGDAESDGTELEKDIARIWSAKLNNPKIGLDQNFFTELGGHSMLAAQVIHELRTQLNVDISVREFYGCPTVRTLALKVTQEAKQAEQKVAARAARTPRKVTWTWRAVSVQVLYFLAIMPLLALPTVAILPLTLEALESGQFSWQLVALGLGLAAATWVGLIIIAIAAKWLIIGRYKPGRYPLWGTFYLRWWIASRLQHLSMLTAFNGTPLAPVLWRAMGAKVGHGCHLDATLVYAWDCISIGDDVSVGADTHVAALRVENGELVIGTVDIGDRCFVGCHSALGLGVKMEPDARLDDQSALPDGMTASRGVGYRGSPPQPSTVPVPAGEPLRVGRFHKAVFCALQLTFGACVALAMLAPVAFAGWLVAVVALQSSVWLALAALIVSVPATMFVFAIWSAICRRVIQRRPAIGTYPHYSDYHLQRWLDDVAMHMIRTIGMPVFTTLYLPPWMRLLGARLGKSTEMATVWRMNPDMITAGDGVFFADGCMLGGTRTHLGRFETAASEIGNHSFVGNSAMLSTGQSMGDGCLLGVLSALPDRQKTVPDNTDWLGSPGFQLPNRQKVASFDKSQTYNPTAWHYLERGIIDALRVTLPGYVLGLFALTSLLTVVAVYNEYGLWGAYTALPLLVWFAMALCITTVLAMKWLIMGRFKPVVVPLWSRYVWWNELINGVYESLMAPWISNFFGTPFAAMLLRTLGCKIGKHSYVETNLFSEFDLVEIGDYAALNAGVVVQNHLFEDRIMKSSSLKVGDSCSVGNMSVILYDSKIEDGAALEPMSLLMKGATMPSSSTWQGIPANNI